MLSGDNSILQKATDAKTKTGVGQEKEALSLAWNSCMVNKVAKYEDITDVQLENELKSNGYNDVSVIKSGNKFKVTFSSGNVYTIKDDGIVQKYEKVEPTAVYAKLYTDGTLILSSTDYTDTTRTIAEDGDYGDVSRLEYTIDNFFLKGEYPGWMVSPLYSANSKITNVVIHDKISPTKIDGWFARTSVADLDLRNLDTSNVTSMQYLFMGCESLANVKLANFNTSNVTSMKYMFGSFGPPTGLTTLDLSNFDTSNVTDMNNMFSRCYNLTNLNISSFDTGNVTDMAEMFAGLHSQTSINLENFDTKKCKNMSGMFYECINLENLNLKKIDTSKVEDMHNMFYMCSKLKELDISSFNTSSVSSMYNMFSNCSDLTTIYASNKFVTTAVTNSGASMFEDSTKLVGGIAPNTTSYNSSKVDTSMAKICTAEVEGYFTSR